MRKFLALLLIIFLGAPMTFTTITVIGVNAWAMNRDFYLQLVGDPRLYEMALADESASIHFGDEEVFFQGQHLPATALDRALREVVTPQYMSDQARRMVNDAFDMVDGRDYTLTLDVDMAPIRAALAGEAGPRVAAALAEALPVCAAGANPLAPGATLPSCRPAELSVAELSRQIAAALPAYAETLPDRVPLGDGEVDLRAEIGHDGLWLAFLPSARAAVIFSIVVLALLTLGIWLLAGFLAGYNERERLQWLGWSLFVPALVIFLVGLLISGSFALNWTRFGLEQAQFVGLGDPAAVRQVLFELSSVVLRAVSNGFMLAGGAPAAMALGLIIWGSSLPTETRLAGGALQA